MSDSVWPYGLQPTRLLCPRNFPGKNTGVASPFSRGSSQPRDRTQISHIAGRFFIVWATREAQKMCQKWDTLLNGWSRDEMHRHPLEALEMQNFCLHSRTTESESVFYQDPQVFCDLHPSLRSNSFKEKVHFLPLISKRGTLILRHKYCYELKNF